MEYIPRKISDVIKKEENFYSIIVITGPRQTGKTTLAKHLFPDYTYFNLEDPLQRDIVESNPRDFILKGPQKMIIDEVQRFPELFSYIQVFVDENPDRKFVLTGSSDFAMMERITQSLAGRAALFTLLPFSFKEIGGYVAEAPTDELMFKGFYPGVLVKDIRPSIFYSNYTSTYIERDARQVSMIEDLDLFRLFIRILAGRVSTEFNASQLSMEIGASAPTIRKWLGILKTSYLVFTLTPYHANLEKRLTKTPKVYFYDTGLLCYLLGIHTEEQLHLHPLRGGIFENLAVSEMIKEKYNEKKSYDYFYYREHGGREVDIMKVQGNDIDLYEVKSSGTFNKSFLKNIEYLKQLLGNSVKLTEVIYDGPTIKPMVCNIREI